MSRVTDVVKHLLLINILIFFAVSFLIPIPNIKDYFTLFSPDTGQFEPYQIVTHMFMHGDLRHLFFNMLLLFFVGPYVETTLGPQRFLGLYLIAGLVSSFAEILLQDNFRAVGASGAINGIFVAFGTMFPNIKLMIFPLPFEIKAKYLVMIYILIDLFRGVSSAPTGIAHFAHLGGALAGFLMIHYWKMANLR